MSDPWAGDSMSAERGWIIESPRPPPNWPLRDHRHTPCDTCGQPTRYKQWPIGCKCPTMSPGRSTIAAKKRLAEIWAEQEQKNAALHRIDYSHIPPLRIADRYVAGRKHG